MPNLNEKKLHVTLRRIRFVSYIVMAFALILVAAMVGFGLAGIEFSFSYKNGGFHYSTLDDLRPFTDRFMVVVARAFGPILLFFGGMQIVLFTECFTRSSVRKIDASRFARNAGIITLLYMIFSPVVIFFAQLLDTSLFIIRKVPWTNAAKVNAELDCQANIIVLSLLLALMFFLVSHMLKVDESQASQLSTAAAE